MAGTKKSHRLLVLDVDNTLLHVPVYDSLLHGLGKTGITEKAYYEGLPEGGILLQEEEPLRVYPRPFLQEFIKEAQALEYDLAACSTATHEYLMTTLLCCGIDPEIFVAIHGREIVDRTKDIEKFTDLGYSIENIVAIDDNPHVHRYGTNVLAIEPFEVDINENVLSDSELKNILVKLKYLGNKSLCQMRAELELERSREQLLYSFAFRSFSRDKYRYLPFIPDIYERYILDIDNYSEDDPKMESVEIVLVYKDFGLVGAIKQTSDSYIVNNFCPDIWNDLPGGKTEYKRNEGNDFDYPIMMWAWRTGPQELKERCKYLGYAVSEKDVMTLHAITMEPTGSDLQLLPYRESLLDPICPISYTPSST